MKNKINLFDKEEYFKDLRACRAAVKAKFGHRAYSQCYTDMRKKVGRRTKLHYCMVATQVAAYINQNFHGLVAKTHMYRGNSVIITQNFEAIKIKKFLENGK